MKNSEIVFNEIGRNVSGKVKDLILSLDKAGSAAEDASSKVEKLKAEIEALKSDISGLNAAVEAKDGEIAELKAVIEATYEAEDVAEEE